MHLSNDDLDFALKAIALVGAVAAWWFGPRRRASAMADAILGSKGQKDRGGGVIEPPQPGLVHRVATLEDSVKIIAAAEAKRIERDAEQVAIDNEIRKLKSEVKRLRARVVGLESVRAERMINQFETGQILRLAADEQHKPPAEPIVFDAEPLDKESD